MGFIQLSDLPEPLFITGELKDLENKLKNLLNSDCKIQEFKGRTWRDYLADLLSRVLIDNKSFSYEYVFRQHQDYNNWYQALIDELFEIEPFLLFYLQKSKTNLVIEQTKNKLYYLELREFIIKRMVNLLILK